MGRKEGILPRCGRAFNKAWRACSFVCNSIKFRAFGIRFGRGFKASGHVYLERKDGAEIVLGRNVRIVSGHGTNRIGRNLCSGIFAAAGARISIGDGSGISCSTIWARQDIAIGNNVNIGADCVVMDHDAHSLDPLRRRDWAQDLANTAVAPVEIGDDVLVGARSIVLKGVRIGHGSVVGAGSVVTCDIPPGEIWAGNPAKFIRKI